MLVMCTTLSQLSAVLSSHHDKLEVNLITLLQLPSMRPTELHNFVKAWKWIWKFTAIVLYYAAAASLRLWTFLQFASANAVIKLTNRYYQDRICKMDKWNIASLYLRSSPSKGA